MEEKLYLSLPKKSDLGITKNYCDITLIAAATKIIMHCFAIVENFLRKNQNSFQSNRSATSPNHKMVFREIDLQLFQGVEGVRAKHFEATLFFVDFSKAFDSIQRGKMEQILLVYGLPKKNCYHYDSQQKHRSNCLLTWWLYWSLLHYRWSFAWGYIGTVSVHNLPTLCITNVNTSNERKRLYTKKDF